MKEIKDTSRRFVHCVNSNQVCSMHSAFCGGIEIMENFVEGIRSALGNAQKSWCVCLCVFLVMGHDPRKKIIWNNFVLALVRKFWLERNKRILKICVRKTSYFGFFFGWILFLLKKEESKGTHFKWTEHQQNNLEGLFDQVPIILSFYSLPQMLMSY